MSPSTLLTFMPLALLGFAAPLIFVQMVKRTDVGLALLLGLFLIEALLITLPPVTLGLTIYPQDLLLGMAFAAGTVRLFLKPDRSSGMKTLLLMGGLILLSLVLGQAQFGKSAGVEFRQFFYFWAAAFYVASTEFDTLIQHGWQRRWLLVGTLLLLIVYGRWGLDAVGITVGQGWAEVGAGIPYRVVNASQTLFLGQAFLIGLFLWLKGMGSPRVTLALPAFGLSLILLQHRTVWIVSAVAISLFVFLERQLNRSKAVLIAVLVLALGTLLIPLWMGGLLGNVQDALTLSVTEATNTEQSTFVWRTMTWQVLLHDWGNLSIMEQLLGQPFGSGYSRYLGDNQILVEASPHNFYVQSLMRIGVLGVLALLCTYLPTIARLWSVQRPQDEGLLTPKTMAILLVIQLIYFVSYGPYYDQGIILGMALAMLHRSQPAAATASEPLAAPQVS